jgi:hypothetical protein
MDPPESSHWSLLAAVAGETLTTRGLLCAMPATYVWCARATTQGKLESDKSTPFHAASHKDVHTSSFHVLASYGV